MGKKMSAFTYAKLSLSNIIKETEWKKIRGISPKNNKLTGGEMKTWFDDNNKKETFIIFKNYDKPIKI